jgi:hypothetical protein
VGYEANPATALVASAAIGPVTSISSGNVINPPPPATALITPNDAGDKEQEVIFHNSRIHSLTPARALTSPL